MRKKKQNKPQQRKKHEEIMHRIETVNNVKNIHPHTQRLSPFQNSKM